MEAIRVLIATLRAGGTLNVVMETSANLMPTPQSGTQIQLETTLIPWRCAFEAGDVALYVHSISPTEPSDLTQMAVSVGVTEALAFVLDANAHSVVLYMNITAKGVDGSTSTEIDRAQSAITSSVATLSAVFSTVPASPMVLTESSEAARCGSVVQETDVAAQATNQAGHDVLGGYQFVKQTFLINRPDVDVLRAIKPPVPVSSLTHDWSKALFDASSIRRLTQRHVHESTKSY